MNKKDTLLVIDGNNYAHRAYHAYSRLSHRGVGVSIIYGMTSMVRSLVMKANPNRLVIVWDGGRSHYRTSLLKGYKNRSTARVNFDYEDFKKQLAHTRKLFKYLGVTQILVPGQEADDMITKCINTLKPKYKKIIIASGDKDFNQLIDENTVIWSGKGTITIDNCQTVFGYKPDQTVDYLSLLGDSSDKIPGYRGMGEIRTQEFLLLYGSIKAYLGRNKQFKKVDNAKLLEVYKINSKLIDLQHYYEKVGKNIRLEFIGKSKPIIRKKSFIKICHRFGLNKLMGNTFVGSFEKMG